MKSGRVCDTAERNSLLGKKSMGILEDNMLLPRQKESLGLEVTPLLGKRDALYFESCLPGRVKLQYLHCHVQQQMPLRNRAVHELDFATTQNKKHYFLTSRANTYPKVVIKVH
ncbi:MAG: hypothetical protein AB8U44_00505 [Aaplasma endosymbiont of Hyalomma asiaticum]